MNAPLQPDSTEQLQHVLSLVNDWLKFAEAKNGALLIASSAIVLGLPTATTALLLPARASAVYITWLTALAVISALLAGYSLLPRTRIPWLLPARSPEATDNLLFFGHIYSFDPDSYLIAIRAKLRQAGIPSPFERDYAEQIVINSRITMEKYVLFRAALWVLLFGALTPVLALPLLIAEALRRRE